MKLKLKKYNNLCFQNVHWEVMKNNEFFTVHGDLIGNISSYEFSVFLHGRNRISAYVNFLSFFSRETFIFKIGYSELKWSSVALFLF